MSDLFFVEIPLTLLMKNVWNEKIKKKWGQDASLRGLAKYGKPQ